jgi:hypothetical protein
MKGRAVVEVQMMMEKRRTERGRMKYDLIPYVERKVIDCIKRKMQKFLEALPSIFVAINTVHIRLLNTFNYNYTTMDDSTSRSSNALLCSSGLHGCHVPNYKACNRPPTGINLESCV